MIFSGTVTFRCDATVSVNEILSAVPTDGKVIQVIVDDSARYHGNVTD